MSTIELSEHLKAVVVTSDALDVLNSFQDGLDEFVEQLATEFAAERQQVKNSNETVRVEVEDVQKAGQRLVEYIRTLVKDGRLPADLESQVQTMGECLTRESR